MFTYFPSQSDGASPRDTLIGVHGILYGTASEGGDNNTGNVFSLTSRAMRSSSTTSASS